MTQAEVFELDIVDRALNLRAGKAVAAGSRTLLVHITHGKRLHQVIVGAGTQRDQVTLMCSCGSPTVCRHADFAAACIKEHPGANAWLTGKATANVAAAAAAGSTLRVLAPRQAEPSVARKATPAPPAPAKAPGNRDASLLERWLRELDDQRTHQDTEVAERKTKVALFFCDQALRGNGLEVKVHLGQPKKTGGYSKGRNLDFTSAMRGGTHLPPADLGLIAALRGHSREGWQSSVILRDGDAHALVHAMIDTGRLFYDLPEPLPLTHGQPRKGAPQWEADAEGTQQPVVRVEGGALPLLFDEPMYIASEPPSIGPLVCEQPLSLLRGFLKGRALPAEGTA